MGQNVENIGIKGLRQSIRYTNENKSHFRDAYVKNGMDGGDFGFASFSPEISVDNKALTFPWMFAVLAQRDSISSSTMARNRVERPVAA